MRNRIKHYGQDITSVDELLEDIKKQHEDFFDDKDTHITDALSLGKATLNERGADAIKLLVFMKHYLWKDKSLLHTRPEVGYLFEVLQAVDNLKRDDENAKRKDPLFELFVLHMFQILVGEIAGGTRGFTDEQMQYREDIFNRRNELPKDNDTRRAFVENYIDEEVFNRFYEEKEREAGRFDNDDEGENYTPAGAREWDAHFNDLCKEYGEEQYCISYEHPDEYYYNITPEDKLYSMHSDRWGREMMKAVKAFQKEHNIEEQN